MPNFGLIETVPDPKDYVLGAETKLPKVVLCPSRDWTQWLPPLELQKDYSTGFDTFGCVTYSCLNVLETLAKFHGMEWNDSDRFTVKASGTSPAYGNTLNRVAESVRVYDGTVPEADYPFVITQAEYYQAIPDSLIDKGQESLKTKKIGYEWVTWAGADKEKMWEALQYSPLQATVDYNAMVTNTIYQNTNHAIVVYAGEYKKNWKIYDQYKNCYHTVDWDFWFGAAMRFYIYPTMQTLIKGDKNADVFALGKNGKKYRLEDSMFPVNEGIEAGFWTGPVIEKPQAEVDAIPMGITYMGYKSLRDV